MLVMGRESTMPAWATRVAQEKTVATKKAPARISSARRVRDE